VARRRIIDWIKVGRFLRKVPWHGKLTFFGMLASVDDFGLSEWSPLRVGQMFMELELNGKRMTVTAVEAHMEYFANLPDPAVITWEYAGFRYFAMRKHQDYQHVAGPRDAECPFPPRELFTKLSGKTQALMCKHFAKFTTWTEPDIRDFLAKTGDIEYEYECESESETEEEKALKGAHSRIKDLYSNLYVGRTGERPLMTAPDFSLLRTRLHEACKDARDNQGKGDESAKVAEKKVTMVVRHALSGDYRDFEANLPSLQTVLGKYHWNRIVSGLAMRSRGK